MTHHSPILDVGLRMNGTTVGEDLGSAIDRYAKSLSIPCDHGTDFLSRGRISAASAVRQSMEKQRGTLSSGASGILTDRGPTLEYARGGDSHFSGGP